jgi:hypothetical protein
MHNAHKKSTTLEVIYSDQNQLPRGGHDHDFQSEQRTCIYQINQYYFNFIIQYISFLTQTTSQLDTFVHFSLFYQQQLFPGQFLIHVKAGVHK